MTKKNNCRVKGICCDCRNPCKTVRCPKCRKNARIRYQANLERRGYTVQLWLSMLYRRSKKSPLLKKRDLVHNITYEHLLEIYEQQGGRCAISKLEMTTKSFDLNSISLDRVNSDLGYVVGNVMLTCKWLNVGRGDRSVDEFKTEVIDKLRAAFDAARC